MTKNQIMKKLESGGMDISAVREVSQSEVEIFVDSGNGRATMKKQVQRSVLLKKY